MKSSRLTALFLLVTVSLSSKGQIDSVKTFSFLKLCNAITDDKSYDITSILDVKHGSLIGYYRNGLFSKITDTLKGDSKLTVTDFLYEDSRLIFVHKTQFVAEKQESEGQIASYKVVFEGLFLFSNKEIIFKQISGELEFWGEGDPIAEPNSALDFLLLSKRNIKRLLAKKNNAS